MIKKIGGSDDEGGSDDGGNHTSAVIVFLSSKKFMKVWPPRSSSVSGLYASIS